MGRTILLAGALPFASAFLGGVLAFSLVVPSQVDAQETRMRAESVDIVDDSGTTRARMRMTGPNSRRSFVEVLSRAGVTRVSMNTGASPSQASAGNLDDGAQLTIFAPGGPSTFPGGAPPSAVLGTADDGTSSMLQLRDGQGQARIWLEVDADGTPSIEMRDASGNVTWRAQ